MRSKKVLAGCGVGGTYTLAEHRDGNANDFGGECETLRPGSSASWAKNSKSVHT